MEFVKLEIRLIRYRFSFSNGVSKDVRFLKHNCVFKAVISDCNTQTYA